VDADNLHRMARRYDYNLVDTKSHLHNNGIPITHRIKNRPSILIPSTLLATASVMAQTPVIHLLTATA
jgi:hypothetical protein